MTCRGNLSLPPQPNHRGLDSLGERVASKVLGQAGRLGDGVTPWEAMLVLAALGPLLGILDSLQQMGTS